MFTRRRIAAASRVPPNPQSPRNRERGAALILVIFVITLASILVVNLAYSTYLESRISSSVQRNVQAEYLLKSTLTLARVLLASDNPDEDSPDDIWATFFYDAGPVPLHFFGINEPGLTVRLEIRPEDTKLNINQLRHASAITDFPDIFTRFFKILKFDADTDEIDQTGFFDGKHFLPDELAANLIDYVDEGDDGWANKGVDPDVPAGYFSNKPMESLIELVSIPGFTPNRLQKVLPSVTTHGSGTSFNVNFITGYSTLQSDVLLSLHDEMTSDMVQPINDRALSQNPFTSNTDPQLVQILPAGFKTSIFDVKSRWFQVVAKVSYGDGASATSSFYLRAFLNRSPSGSPLPDVHSVELY